MKVIRNDTEKTFYGVISGKKIEWDGPFGWEMTFLGKIDNWGEKKIEVQKYFFFFFFLFDGVKKWVRGIVSRPNRMKMNQKHHLIVKLLPWSHFFFFLG
jgi:hypothetical protein